jgi:hypothetical protein
LAAARGLRYTFFKAHLRFGVVTSELRLFRCRPPGDWHGLRRLPYLADAPQTYPQVAKHSHGRVVRVQTHSCAYIDPTTACNTDREGLVNLKPRPRPPAQGHLTWRREPHASTSKIIAVAVFIRREDDRQPLEPSPRCSQTKPRSSQDPLTKPQLFPVTDKSADVLDFLAPEPELKAEGRCDAT